MVVALPLLLEGGSSCVAPGPRFVLGMLKSSNGGNTLTSPAQGTPERAKCRIPREKAAKSGKELSNGTNQFEGADHEFCLAQRRFLGARTM